MESIRRTPAARAILQNAIPAAEPALAAITNIQRAIALDVRDRLGAQLQFVDDDAAPSAPGLTLRLRPGAGALLLPQTLRTMLETASAADLREVTLPLAGQTLPSLPRSAGLCFTVSSGTDLLALALHPDIGPATLRAVSTLAPDTRRLALALRNFADRAAEVMLIGLTDSSVWQYLEDQVACRVRVFADAGPANGGLAAILYQETEPAQFLRWLPSLGNAALINSRLLWEGQPPPSPADFFWSDLGQPAAIQHPGLRRLTELTLASAAPIILGSPTLVNSALYALVETAWRTGPDLNRGYQIAW